MKKHAFTLVELLVVIGIIGILSALIIPAVGLARASAKATQCQHNQEQTMKIVAQAMNANKDCLVSGGGDSDPENPGKYFDDDAGADAAWTRYLYGGDLSSSIKGKTAYIADMAVVRCPSFKYEDNNKALGALTAAKRAAALEAAYGMVYSTATVGKFKGFDFRGTKLLKYSNYAISPNQLLLGGCSALSKKDQDQAEALLWNGNLIKIHGDKCNIFFLDGHTEGLAEDELKTKYYPEKDASATVKFSRNWIDPDDE